MIHVLTAVNLEQLNLRILCPHKRAHLVHIRGSCILAANGNDHLAVCHIDSAEQITGGTANYRNITDEAILRKIYETFKEDNEA